MARVKNMDQVMSKRKAITAFFPYAVWQGRAGNRGVVEAFLDVAMASNPVRKLIDWDGFMWKEIRPFVNGLFDETSPDSLNQVLILVSPYVLLETWCFNRSMVTRWAAAALAVPETEEMGQSVVAVLLQLAFLESPLPCIPIKVWAWLKKLPSLPRARSCTVQSLETSEAVVRRVQALENIEILKSYFLLVWSDWYPPWDSKAICSSIHKDFSGIGMGSHRRDLIERLDHVLGELDQGLEYLQQHSPGIHGSSVDSSKDQYKEFKRLLLGQGQERETLGILTRTPFRIDHHLYLLTLVDVHRIPFDICLCAPSRVSVAARLRPSLLGLPISY